MAPKKRIAPATAKAWEPPCLAATGEFPAISSPPKGSFLQQLGQEREKTQGILVLFFHGKMIQKTELVEHWMVQHLGALWAQNPLETRVSRPGQSCLKTCSMSIDAIRESGWKPEFMIIFWTPPHPISASKLAHVGSLFLDPLTKTKHRFECYQKSMNYE